MLSTVAIEMLATDLHCIASTRVPKVMSVPLTVPTAAQQVSSTSEFQNTVNEVALVDATAICLFMPKVDIVLGVSPSPVVSN
ncbi:MAG: hypothetical protein ACE5E8_08790 [Acidimicrobiia bacterium]